MNRSDRIYLSKFALDPDPEYLDLDDFDLDGGQYSEEFDDDLSPHGKKNSLTEIRKYRSDEIQATGDAEMDEDGF